MNEVFNLYTLDDTLRLLVVLLIVPLLLGAYVRHYLNENRYYYLIAMGNIISLLLFSILTLLSSRYLDIINNGYQQLGIYITLLIANLSLLNYIRESIDEKKRDNSDPDHTNRYHFKSTINSAFIMVIIGMAFGFFAPSTIGQVIMVSAISTSLAIAGIHLLVIRLFQDNAEIIDSSMSQTIEKANIADEITTVLESDNTGKSQSRPKSKVKKKLQAGRNKKKRR